jgi:hypothetical protein
VTAIYGRDREKMDQPIQINTRGTATWLFPGDKGFVLSQGSSRVKLDADEARKLHNILAELLIM